VSAAKITRRDFVVGGLGGALLTGGRPECHAEADEGPATYRLFWGDLHNHNAVGYGKGSLERSIDLARAHLDFFAFTGHASWHDMPKMPGDRHLHWVRGFEAHRQHWPKTRQLIRAASTRDFTALLGYEWHSSQFGDYCLLFAEDQPDLFLPDHADKLLDFAAARKALAIPHHVGYKQGWRGANWNHFRAAVRRARKSSPSTAAPNPTARPTRCCGTATAAGPPPTPSRPSWPGGCASASSAPPTTTPAIPARTAKAWSASGPGTTARPPSSRRSAPGGPTPPPGTGFSSTSSSTAGRWVRS